jgi:hypothetical protein
MATVTPAALQIAYLSQCVLWILLSSAHGSDVSGAFNISTFDREEFPAKSVYPTGALAVEGYHKDGSPLAHPFGGGLFIFTSSGSLQRCHDTTAFLLSRNLRDRKP